MFVNKVNYKYGLLFTQLLLLLSVLVIAASWSDNGDWVRKAVDLSGGTEITFKFSGELPPGVEDKISGEYNARPRVFRSSEGGRISITGLQGLNATDVASFVERSGVTIDGEPSVSSIGPALGSSFWKQAQLSILFGFVLMGMSVYLIYRSPVPSLAIILSAASNMLETVAVMNLLGMEMSLGGIAALLMMIGYSVDTNVVLTTRLLKREFGMEDFDKTMKNSMATGLTMSATSIAALLAIIFFSPASVLTQIASVLIIGLVFDVPNTWLQNSAILRWHLHA
ncbi:MAG: protein translocase subunit SecF [Candidatus Aenigmarchaeota archaeon]|nr:protein translocase subunit SecF [Candidatus Aenigmarchaeota archaeon]